MRNCLSLCLLLSFRGAARTEMSMDKAARQRSSETFVKIMWWRLAPERVSHEETNINQSKKTKSSVVKFGLVKVGDYCAKPFQRDHYHKLAFRIYESKGTDLMGKTFTSLHPKEEVSDEERLMAAVQSPQGLKTGVSGVERFQVLRQNADSVLADAVHMSSTTHACAADAGASQ
ncbi:hypothetical protein DPX16_23060 [Anabarilius grahami]|uniref:Uncharacterized protein n=1 Tax=Anabarilius grahami TaxID=495550 RepID=A0A3N0XIC8_ANAGA|nr:hypothetical protein DPX16_23060 [Anabarilius grahami]